MEEKDDGGQAFPMVDALNAISYGGMTLRDYFAAQALQGFAFNDPWGTAETMAVRSYAIADSMLEARKS